MKPKATVLAIVLAFGNQALATPIVVAPTKDGFVIGTNSFDTGGKDVCKIHYAGSTVVLRATSFARLYTDPSEKVLVYDSTLAEWGVLNPKMNMSDVSSKTKQFFITSTKHLADLKLKQGSGATKDEILKQFNNR